MLENLYTDPDFPPKAQKLEASLKSTGKSRHNNKYPSRFYFILFTFHPRADLWAYAAKVAIEYTTEQNNFQCRDSPGDWVEGGGSEIIGAEDCMRNKGEADCEVGSGYLIELDTKVHMKVSSHGEGPY